MSELAHQPGDQLGRAVRALWPNLPVLLAGSTLVAVGWSVVRVLSPQLGSATAVALWLLVLPPFAALIRGCEILLADEHFGVTTLVRTLRSSYGRTLAVSAPVAAAVLATLVAFEVWQLSGQPWMLASVAAAGAVSVVGLYTAVVALPYLVRTGARMRAGWLVGFYIATRNPLPLLAVVSAVALSVWSAAYLSFAVILLLPGPLALVWAAAVATITERSQLQLADQTSRIG